MMLFMNTSTPICSDVRCKESAGPTSAEALILGCGFLGRRVARALLQRSVKVHGATRSQDHAAELAAMGVHPLLLSVNQRITLAAMSAFEDGREMDVYYMIPPGKPEPDVSPRERLLGGVQNVLASLRGVKIRRAILTSSTAVYGPADGPIVSADTRATPANSRAQLLLDAENLWLAAGPSFAILRLAGLYGPGRVIGQAGIAQGAPIAGDPQGLLNLIYVNDAVELLLGMMGTQNSASVELGSDGQPVTRITYYNHLASLLGKPAPKIIEPGDLALEFGLPARNLGKAASKACDPGLTCQRTGWQPRVTDFREGLALALARPAV
jgi:nucleoside-diphosphate-sugar epimerase